MSTVIYLFNQKVQILTGKATKDSISVKKSYIETAPEGSIINGIVMDVELFVGFLKELVESKKLEPKDSLLVVSSTKFVGRTIELPALNEKKTSDYIMRDFADIGKTSDSLYGYINLPGDNKKFKKVYAENIDPEFISDYVEIFAEAGIKLKGIYSGESCLIDFASQTIAKDVSTFDLIIADDTSLITVLWVEGAFYYYNSARTFNTPGTEAYASDIARSVSQLNQFIQTRRIETPLEKVIIAGVDLDDIGMYSEAIREIGINTPVSAFRLRGKNEFNGDEKLFFHAITGLYSNGKNSNFLSRLSTKKTEKASQKEGRKAKFILLCIALIMVGLTSLLWVYKFDKESQLQELDDYINSPMVMMDVLKHDNVATRNNFLNQQYRSISDINDNLYTYPLGNETIIKYIDSCANGYAEVTYSSFDSNNGSLSFTAVAADVEMINQFIKNLASEEIFKDVDYTGYRFDDNNNMWNINVTCILAESAGKGAK